MKEVWRQLSIRNQTSNLSLVRRFVGELLDELALPPETRYQIILAVDEAVSNIMEHAYGTGSQGPIHLEVRAVPSSITFRFVDEGRTFQPATVTDPDLAEHFRAGKRKGLGIYLMRRIMDAVDYKFGEVNELTLIKRLGPTPHTPEAARGMKEDNLHARF